ncbi:MAG: hypothetical protein IT166_01635 [Bryobacterales bacterium]|nr:hypothetical protein [Bryobacterales bacterium]
MLNAVANSSTKRLIEVRDYLHLIQTVQPAAPIVKPDWIAAKGLFFVHLYAAYEFTVTAAFRTTLQVLGSSGLTLATCHPAFLSVALDAELKAVFASGNKKHWEKRRALFQGIKSSSPLQLNDNLLPTDGSHFRTRHLQCLWDTLCIKDPVVPRPPLMGRIDELVENRNNVAHGRESAVAIGGRYSVPDLRKRYDDVHEVCTYLLQVLAKYLTDKQYIV